MKVISVEQFQLADKRVQNEIMKWWEPQIMDLYVPLDGDPTVIYRQSQLEAVRKLKNEGNIPLLTVGQLIDFIESKTGYYLEIRYDENNDYGYIFDLGLKGMKHYSRYVDLLKALWELVEIICEQI